MAAGSSMETLLGSLDGGTLERIGRQPGTDRSGAETATRTGIATLVGALARDAAGGGDGDAARHGARLLGKPFRR